MWTIVEDTVGRHDFLLTPCSPETFSIIYETTGHHPSCFENLVQGLAPFGIVAGRDPDDAQRLHERRRDRGQRGADILPPRSRAGDHLLLRAEMDLIVGVTACSAELSNNGSFKPIDVEVHAPPAAPEPARAERAAPASA